MGIGHSAAALDALRPLREQYIEAAPRGLQRRAAVDEVVEVVRDEDAQGPHHIDLERAGDMVQSLVAAVEAALPDPEPKPLAQLVAQLDADALPLAPQFEAFTIPADDPRVPLRGMQGLRAKATLSRRLPPGTFLGYYQAEVRLKSEQEEYLARPPAEWVRRVGGDACKHLWRAAVSSYRVEHPNYNAQREEEGEEGRQLFASAVLCGNETMLANDGHADPFQPAAGDPLPNVSVFEVHVAGWPFLAMFTTARVKPGEELRYGYGSNEYSLDGDIERAAARRLLRKEREERRKLQRELQRLRLQQDGDASSSAGAGGEASGSGSTGTGASEANGTASGAAKGAAKGAGKAG